MKVCHLTSVHNNRDIRIFIKECASLAQAGYEVYHVAFGESREEFGVTVIGLGPAPASRKKRMLTAGKTVYKAAKALDCDVYHFHDPELLRYGVKLKKAGKKVIFDSHEDVPAQILGKGWIPTPLRKLVSKVYRAYETRIVKKLDAVVTATPYIGEQFRGRAKKVMVVNNYPKLDDIQFCDTPFHDRGALICYVGGLNEIRGAKVMREAMAKVQGTLYIAGPHSVDPDTYPNTVFVGVQDRQNVNRLMDHSVAGLCMYMPTGNHINAQPNKMFEYMSAGLPFVASDFPLWKKIAEKWNCGICASPSDPDAVAEAMNRLLSDRALAQEMGHNGRKAVLEEYNWDVEEKKLLELYQAIC